MRAILYPYKVRRQLEAERDCYRKVLEWISENDPDDGVVVTGRRGIFGEMAREALRDCATSGDPKDDAPTRGGVA